MINKALEKSKNICKCDFKCIFQYLIVAKFSVHKYIFTALGTIVLRKFGTCWLPKKLKGILARGKY